MNDRPRKDKAMDDKAANHTADSRASVTRWGMCLAAFALVGGITLIMWAKSDHPSTANRQPPEFNGEAQQFIPSRDLRPAPQTPFSDSEGRSMTIGDFRGQVVIVNFWATWCVPCVQEMAALDRLQSAIGDQGATVLAISQDRGGLDAVRPFYDKLRLARLGIHLDPKGAVARAFGVTGLPVTLIVDRQGREVGRLSGPAAWDSPEAITLVRHYLGGR